MEFGTHDLSKYEFGDVENYKSNTDPLSFRMIVLKQLTKISGNANCELRGGYWQEKATPMPNGMVKLIEEYIPDTRETYSNSIEFLHDLIIPHFKSSGSKALKQSREDMQLASKEHAEKIEEIMKEYMKDGKFSEEEKSEFRKKRVVLCRKLFQAICIYSKAENYFGEVSN